MDSWELPPLTLDLSDWLEGRSLLRHFRGGYLCTARQFNESGSQKPLTASSHIKIFLEFISKKNMREKINMFLAHDWMPSPTSSSLFYEFTLTLAHDQQTVGVQVSICAKFEDILSRTYWDIMFTRMTNGMNNLKTYCHVSDWEYYWQGGIKTYTDQSTL